VKRAVIRLPSEIVDRLDQLAEELNTAFPGKRFSRSSVVRLVLSRGVGAFVAFVATGAAPERPRE
jgi:predicted transcriptional regulator